MGNPRLVKGLTRRCARWIPKDLRVIVRVEVDDAGGNYEALRIDDLMSGAVDLSDLDHLAVGDRDVGTARRRAGSVDDITIADNHVEGGHSDLPIVARHHSH